MRVGGSRHLARAGVHAFTIMVMARWGPKHVIQYLKDAALVSITAEFKKGPLFRAGATNAHQDIPDSKAKKFQRLAHNITTKIAQLENQAKIDEETRADMNERLKRTEGIAEQRYIVSKKRRPGITGSWHLVEPWVDRQPVEWKTVCSLAYAGTDFERRAGLDSRMKTERLCDRCFRSAASSA